MNVSAAEIWSYIIIIQIKHRNTYKPSIYSLDKTLFTNQQIPMNTLGAELTIDELKTQQAIINLDTPVLSALW